MSDRDEGAPAALHRHVFLGEQQASAERRTWAVIALCAATMAVEIVGGWLFGSIALIADGLHMSTHVGALTLAALAYVLARRYADDPRFTFGAGKLGDLAGFSSAIALGLVALLMAYESVARLFAPTPIHFAEAIPIACLGLAVNVASVWLLSGAEAGGHAHRHGGARPGHARGAAHRVAGRDGALVLEIFEDGVPPRFRLRAPSGPTPLASEAFVAIVRPDGARRDFAFVDRGAFLESVDEVPEPHEFVAEVAIGGATYAVAFTQGEHAHGAAARDNNLRAAALHVIADATVSALVIVGLTLARLFGWLWMDPIVGLIGAGVIASWSYGLARDAGAILLDMNPDRELAERLRRAVESDGDVVADLHLWRLGPGHLGAIVSVATRTSRDEAFYRAKLERFRALSHLTIEVRRAAAPLPLPARARRGLG